MTIDLNAPYYTKKTYQNVISAATLDTKRTWDRWIHVIKIVVSSEIKEIFFSFMIRIREILGS